MSLQVWLPLNGDLRNQGLSNITAINNGATVDNNGKIGKCYSFDGNDDFINLGDIGSYFDGSAFSICFWIYSLENKTRAAVFSSYGLSSTSNFFGLELNSSNNNYCNNNLRFDWLGSDTYSPDDFVTYDAWTHICVTYDGVNQIKMYKNGTLIQTSTRVLNAIPVGNTYYLGRDSRTGSTAFNGKLNDFRIYDHCLSPRECKQVSTALVLHYPLNRGGFGADNLVLDSVNKTRSHLESGNEYICINLGNSYMNLPSGTQVTISFDLEMKVGKVNNYFLIYNTNNKGPKQITQINIGSQVYAGASVGDVIKKHVYAVTTIVDRDSPTLSDNWIEFYSIYNTGNVFKISNLKIEKGSSPTPWTPAPSDDLYSQMGLDNNIEYDVSGYRHNGTKYGTLTYSSDTPRYNTSTVFNGTDNCIKFPFNDFCTNGDIFTMNIWWKKTELGSKKYETLIGGPSGFEMDTRAGSAQTLSLYMASTRGGNVYPSFNMNEWYMITLVNDGTNELYYVNGVLVKTIEKKNMPSGNYYIGAWQTEAKQNFQGNMSDFRFYKTTLSAQDVYNLYTVGASLSDTGVLFSNEVSEV